MTRIVLLIAIAALVSASVAVAMATESLPTVLLSRQLMSEAHVRTGDIITLASDASGSRATRFRVAGMYEPTPDPMKFTAKRLNARMHLPDLMALTPDASDPQAGESITAINLTLKQPDALRAFAATLAQRTPNLVVQSAARPNGTNETFIVLDRFHWAIAIVTVIASTAFLLALMVMRAEERREIIGILRLMGIPARSILLEVLVEGLLIALGGAVFGVLLAMAGQGLVNRFFEWRYDTPLLFVRVTASIAWRSVAFAVPLGVLAGLAASWTLLRRSAVSLVRR